jgi:RNA polymerase sigma-70 factor, ECF subfamily
MRSKVDPTELKLFRKIRSGNLSDLKTFIEKYQNRVFRYCYVIIGDQFKAEHYAMITFEKFYSNIHKIKQEEYFLSYMFKIARNLCKDKIRKDQREEFVSPIPDEEYSPKTFEDYVEPDMDENPMAKLTEKESQEQIRSFVNLKMQKLPYEQRQAIYLVHYEKLSYEHAAEFVDCPVGTIKSRVNKGMKNLTWSLIKNKIRNLELEHRTAVYEVCVNKCSFKKAAEVSDCSEKVIRERYNEALKKLFKIIRKEIEGLRPLE